MLVDNPVAPAPAQPGAPPPVPHEPTLRQRRKAARLNPEQPGRAFLAAVMRRLVNQATPLARLAAERRAGVDEGFVLGEEHQRGVNKHALEELAAYRKIVGEFEACTGLRLNTWDPECGREIGDAVRQVLKGEHHRAREYLAHLLEQVRGCAGRIEQALAESEPAFEKKEGAAMTAEKPEVAP